MRYKYNPMQFKVLGIKTDNELQMGIPQNVSFTQ